MIIKLRQVRNEDDKRGKTIKQESKKTKVSQGKMKSSNMITEKKAKGVMKKRVRWMISIAYNCSYTQLVSSQQLKFGFS